MDILRFDPSVRYGAFKPLNATNGGPWHKRHANDQWRTNMDTYTAARIPYSRNHDSNLCSSIYGGPYAHDITAIFPDFDADPNDPASYDFPCTDESILTTLDAGTETFFRLGQTIEHQIKKHGTLPPKDFHKWAVICEHIIRHYNEGWADGLHLNIQYWEIWNEPDLDTDDSKNKRTWGGTKAQFFDLFEITAKHLKACFPQLKIGGPALAGRIGWGADFLAEMHRRDVPMDFFSWHIYATEPEQIMQRAAQVRTLMDQNGYEKADSILNEWNYVRGWTDDFLYSIESIIGVKGATFAMATIAEAQRSSIDLLMYYDTRPSSFCGVFDYYTYRPRKTYYALYWYGMFYDMAAEIRCETNVPNIYTLSGVDKDCKTLTIVTYYTEHDDTAPEREIQLDFTRPGSYEVYLLDETHDGEKIDTPEDLRFTMKPCSSLLIREI